MWLATANSHSYKTRHSVGLDDRVVSSHPSTDPIRPTLGYRDARSAIAFLEKAFGFQVVVLHDETEGGDEVLHAELRLPGGGTINVHSGSPTSVADLLSGTGPSHGFPPVSIHVETDDPDTLYWQALDADAVVIRKLQDSPFGVGTRGFIVQDPEGLYWSVGTPLPPLRRDAAGKWSPA